MSQRPFLLAPESDAPFPPAELALRQPDGLLAVGGDLSASRLLNAYRGGIFPWFSEGQPLLWWSPDPRMVFRTDHLHLASRFRRGLRRSSWRVHADTAFDAVVAECASRPRPGQDGTWITDAMREAYGVLHRAGHAHSIEVFDGARLVGGLYGVAIGRMFFGESMFSAESGGSKVAIAALAALMVGGGWRSWPRLALRWPSQQAGVMAASPVAWGYCLLAGWGVPAQRTLYMLGCVSLALVLRRDVAPSRVLAAALGVVVVIDPWSVLSAGFWLSFGAVAVLLLVSAGRLGPGGWLTTALRTQWAVTLGLVPALLVLFQQFSLVSPFANAIAIPLISFVVTPLALLFALLPLQMLADLAHGAMVLTMLPVAWLGELPGATWQQAAPPPVLAVLAGAGCLWALLPRGTPARPVGLLPLLALLLWSPERPPEGQARVTVLDVGQGLAVHVQTAGHDLLYDTGPAFSADANSGERILLPYLRAVGVRRLDALVVSHQDQDHAGGAESVLAGLPVARVLASLPYNHPLRLIAGPRAEACAAGQAWDWDGVRFRVLHPADPVGEGRAGNEAACVLQVEAGGRKALLSSDIEAASESRILAREGHAVASEFVVAPHHGSRTSSTAAFIAATAPR